MTLRVLFSGAAVFLSAALLFWVEPLFAKRVLPLLGGSAAVWNTALVFYQGTLLAGYLYAHFGPRLLGVRTHARLHLALLAVPLLVLPLSVPEGWTRPPEQLPVLWLLGLFVITLGPPFFLLATTAPLIQEWLGRTAGPEGEDPYFLYAVSNLGSLAALLAFPLVLQPGLPLETQSEIWSWGYGVVALLVAACAVAALRAGLRGSGPDHLPGTRGSADPGGGGREPGSAVVTGSPRLRWTLRALAPSALLLAVTSHVTTDLAAVPLLWVVPLALYLVTYAVAFARREWIPRGWTARAAVPLALLLVLDLASPGLRGLVGLEVVLPFHLLAFFVISLACHQQLARDRPAVEHLTDFYLRVALGGVLGGILVAVVVPGVLDARAEYPAALALAAGLVALGRRGWRFRWSDVALPLGLAAAVGVPALRAGGPLAAFPSWEFFLFFALAAGWVWTGRRRPVRLALGVGALALAASWVVGPGDVVLRERTFYGVLRVREPRPDLHVLYHGTTMHGAQRLEPGRRTDPLTYYHRDGPVGQLFRTLRGEGLSSGDRGRERLERVGVVGLGTGAMACYREPGEDWTFFEIDRAVVRIARDTTLFRYLSTCAPEARVVTGDGRISLRREPDGAYDLLVLDAFSSDAVPVHLLTREAFRLYFEKLGPDGVVAVHVSNRYLELGGVVGAAAAGAGWVGRVGSHDFPDSVLVRDPARTSSRWVVLGRETADLAGLARDPRWTPLIRLPRGSLWTDDHSNLVEALRF